MRLQGVCPDLVKHQTAPSPATAQSEGLLQHWASTWESSGPAAMLDAHIKWATFRSRSQTREKYVNLTLSQTLFNCMKVNQHRGNCTGPFIENVLLF